MHGMNGIAGLTGREPVGAVLTVGHKVLVQGRTDRHGNPMTKPADTDRFFIVVPQEVEGFRAEHPSFTAFNTAEPSRRTVVRGNLLHASPEGAWEHHRKAQVLKGLEPHPAKGPHCMGDGVRAQRWLNGAYQDIPCPGDRCEFAQPTVLQNGNEGPTPCKPWMRFLFRPRWPDGSSLPTPLMKYTSGAWNTTAHFLGFFEHVLSQAQQLGVERFSLYGLPFVLTLEHKKRKGETGSRTFPVVRISTDGDLLDFLDAQRKRIAALGTAPARAALPAPPPVPTSLLDADQQDYAEVGADTRTVSGPGVIDVSVPSGGSK